MAACAAPARWTPLLLTAVMFCLAVAVVGLRWGAAQTAHARVVAAVASQSLHRSGIPAPDRAPVTLHTCTAVEKEAETGRLDPDSRAAALPPCRAGTGVAAATAGWAMFSLPARPLRSHLSQAPPDRA